MKIDRKIKIPLIVVVIIGVGLFSGFSNIFNLNMINHNPLIINISEDFVVNFYSSTFPNNGFLSEIQKGGELVYNEDSLLGEGYGFGSPILIKNNISFLSGTSKLSFDNDACIRKSFFIDRKNLSKDYQAKFEKINTLGSIEFRYCLESDNWIDIEVNINIEGNFNYLVIANEQNSNFFQYFDSDNTYTENLPRWNETFADTSCFTNKNGIRFCVNSPSTQKFFGKEYRESYLDWAGISIIRRSSESFKYKLKITSLNDRHFFKSTPAPVISSPVPFYKEKNYWHFSIGDWAGNLYVLPWNLSENSNTWTKTHSSGIFSSPVTFTCSNSEDQCIALSTENGSILIYNKKGMLIKNILFASENFFWSTPVYTGKGLGLIGKNYFYYFDLDGNPIEGWPQPINDWGDSSPAYHPKTEYISEGIITVSTLTQGNVSEGFLYAWWENGTSIEGFPIQLGEDSDSSPIIVDINGDFSPEIIIGDDSGEIHAFNLTGLEIHGFPVKTSNLVEASPSIARTSPDGTYIIVIGSWDNKLYVIDSNGNLLLNFPVSAQDQIISSAALVDLTGDSIPEIIVGSKDFGLYIWNLTGHLLPFYPFNLSHHVFSSPLVMDLDNNGFLDIVVGANNGIHVLIDIGVGDFNPWPMFKKNPQRTGNFI